MNPRPFEALRLRLDVAVLQGYLGAQRGKPFQVQVDGTGADGATAGKRYPGLAKARQERPEHQDRGTHGAHQVIGRLEAVQVRRVDLDDVSFSLHAGPQLLENLDGGVDVAQEGDIADLVAAGRQDGGDEYGE